ncbi:MAG: NACHT domain-containing protein, partial [Anaerolineaceae bacterium]
GVDVGKIAESFCQDLMRVDSLPEAEIAPIESGRLIAGRYKLLQPIGDDSGQATVWQAQDMNDPQLPPVAIKCMKPHPTRDYASRFIEEVRSLRELDEHPHIMPIYDYGIDGGLRYLVMPQMRGSLRAALDEAGRLSPDVALDYLRQMADALDFAHRHDIIHRDLKPANMLFTRETSRLCLADFGIAYRTHRQNPVTGTGETAATEEYAAPEQLRSTGNVTEKSDIYALAIIAYELLAGERPFKGSKAEIAAQHLDTTLELPEHEHLAPFVLQVLRMGGAKDAALRPQKATDFITHLGDALDGKAPEVIQHYLDEVMPNHLREVMPEEVFKGLKRAFIDPQVEIRQQITIAKPQADDDDDELDWDLFPPDVRDEAPPPPPQIELSGEFHPPREGRYSDQVEYVEDVRGRIGGLQRVVLLGAPGAGKTFMLGRLALDYADGCRVDPAAPLPVFVPLSQYNTAQTFEAFVAARMGALGERLSEHKVLWLLDALNEMPRDKGQWRHLKAFIDQLVQAEAPFILTCRVKNYEEDLHDVPGLHRVDLQDLNPQQIYDILTHFLRPKYADPIWETVMHGAGLREAWVAWKGSVRAFWQMPGGWHGGWNDHERARGRIHDDPRKLMLLCRNPFTLVRLLVVRMGKAIRRCGGDLTALTVQLEEELPNNRALLFGAVIEDMVGAEAGRRGWTEADHAAIHAALEFTSAALQATEQRTEIALADLLNAENAPANLIEWLRKGRDAGIITLTETAVRFNHQLYQEYFATKKLRDLLADYTRRHPDWEAGDALPPRDERLAELFPRWWEVGGWRVTVALLGELEGRTGINRVVRWLASYAPETAANMVADNNDGLTFEDLTAAAREALITSALEKIK